MDIKVGIIGDLIIDKFKYFKSVRLSPEGPAPVVIEKGRDLCAGGAGNLATSIANLGLKTSFYYALSNDEASSIKKNIDEVFKDTMISKENNKYDKLTVGIKELADKLEATKVKINIINEVNKNIQSNMDVVPYSPNFTKSTL